MKTTYEEREAEATRAMLAGERPWPHMVLPVKNRREEVDGWPKLGVVLEPGEPVIVYVSNMFALASGPKEKLRYESINEAMAAGWVVD